MYNNKNNYIYICLYLFIHVFICIIFSIYFPYIYICLYMSLGKKGPAKMEARVEGAPPILLMRAFSVLNKCIKMYKNTWNMNGKYKKWMQNVFTSLVRLPTCRRRFADLKNKLSVFLNGWMTTNNKNTWK